MTAKFFLALLGFLLAPVLLSRVLGIGKIFPLVFIQLLLGLVLQASGGQAWLQAQGMDLTQGALAQSLYGLGWLGISLLIALTAAESAPADSDKKPWQFIPISIAGFFSTCLLGCAVGYWLGNAHPELLGNKADIGTFALAIGLSLSVTALPVLVSILRETGMAGTRLGNLATHCSMLDDIWLWLGMALILSLVAMGDRHPLQIVALLAVYGAGMLLVLRPLLRRWFDVRTFDRGDSLLVAAAVIFSSAIATDAIGLHSILGVFVGGAILPRRALEGWREALLNFSRTLLLPFFFVLTGMRLQVDMRDGLFWQLTAIVTVAAIAGKFSSVALAARCCGNNWSDALTLGSLMQCKGLMELIAINILLDAGVIASPIFCALAMMALVSTFLTAPLMKLMAERSTRPVMQRNAALADAG